MITPKTIIRFLDGRMGDTISIAFLPLDLGAHMPTTQTEVRIERSYAHKLKDKHQITYFQLDIIQRCIDFGWCIKHKKNHLEFIYSADEEGKVYYLLVLKTAAFGTETWLVSFYRIRPKQIKSHLKRGKLLRSHVW